MKLLLFDLDGTLVLAGGAGRKALNRAIENVYGIKQDCAVYKLGGKTDLRNFAEAIEGATGRRPKRAAIERVHKEYLRLLPAFVKKAVRLKTYTYPPGIKVLLKTLARRKDAMLALGTGNMKKGARIKLAPSGFNRYFSFGGYGCDSFYRPALLLAAYRRALKRKRGAGLKKKDVFVIGDTPLDVSAGKAAGFRTVAVCTGWTPRKELAAAKPDFLARDFRNVKRWLDWFGLKDERGDK